MPSCTRDCVPQSLSLRAHARTEANRTDFAVTKVARLIRCSGPGQSIRLKRSRPLILMGIDGLETFANFFKDVFYPGRYRAQP